MSWLDPFSLHAGAVTTAHFVAPHFGLLARGVQLPGSYHRGSVRLLEVS